MKNLKRIRQQRKFHVRSGDVVVVISGSHRGKIGKVLYVIARSSARTSRAST